MKRYQEIAEWINMQISNGTYKEGGKLPSENELRAQFDVTRQTIRHALSYLEEHDVIYKVQGSGTFVKGERSREIRNRSRIAVVITYFDICGYIFPQMLRGVEEALAEAGYTMQLSLTYNKKAREREILHDILEKDEVAGIIIEGTQSALPNYNRDLYFRLKEKGIPILFINSYYPDMDFPYVSVDDIQSGYVTTKYLINQGHRKIGGIFKLDDGQGRMRYAGYIKALREHHISVNEEQVLWVDSIDMRNLESVKERILHRLNGCSAVFCYNDEIAFAMSEILLQNHIKIPEDISIIGMDNSDLGTIGKLQITSATHPKAVLGKKAAENLVAMIKNPLYDGTYIYDVEIVERESVKAIK